LCRLWSRLRLWQPTYHVQSDRHVKKKTETEIFEGGCYISQEVDSHPSESPREATQILCSIITTINTVVLHKPAPW
jgi:hypothetical protein